MKLYQEGEKLDVRELDWDNSYEVSVFLREIKDAATSVDPPKLASGLSWHIARTLEDLKSPQRAEVYSILIRNLTNARGVGIWDFETDYLVGKYFNCPTRQEERDWPDSVAEWIKESAKQCKKEREKQEMEAGS